MSNILKGAKTYLVGAMQYSNGRAWREEISEKLDAMGIVCFDPYKKPFVVEVQETEKTHAEIEELIQKGEYDEVARIFKRIRSYDLALVDKADFLIAYIDPEILTVGSWEEIFWSNRLKRAIFLIIEGGKNKCPYWLFGTIPHKYIYNSLDEVVEVLQKIDSGEKTIDNDRWRLLRPEFR